jgi:hypothetical protein
MLLYCQRRVSVVVGSSTSSYGLVVENNLECEGSEEKQNIHVAHAIR